MEVASYIQFAQVSYTPCPKAQTDPMNSKRSRIPQVDFQKKDSPLIHPSFHLGVVMNILSFQKTPISIHPSIFASQNAFSISDAYDRNALPSQDPAITLEKKSARTFRHLISKCEPLTRHHHSSASSMEPHQFRIPHHHLHH